MTIGVTSANFDRSRSQRIRDRELRRVAELQEQLGLMTDDEQYRLTELVDLYVKKFPWIVYAKGSSRAHKGMAYLLDGHVRHMGGDEWLVKGHRCRLEGRQCPCEDRVRFDKVDGKLCAHRIAVMLRQNWHGKRCRQLAELIEELAEHEYIDLYMERDYAYHGHGDRVAVAGYLLPGGSRPVHWLSWERFEISLLQFQYELEEAGYGLVALPEKLSDASHYYYRIASGEGIPICKASFGFRGTTEAMSNREKMRRLSAIELAVTLHEVTGNSAVMFNFSEYESRRIWAMKEAIDKYGIRAVDIDELPENIVNLVMIYLYGKKEQDNEYQ